MISSKVEGMHPVLSPISHHKEKVLSDNDFWFSLKYLKNKGEASH